MQNAELKEVMASWKKQSSEEIGFHEVITPDKSACKVARLYRLNLKNGDSFKLESGELEMHPVLIKGAAKLSKHTELNQTMKQFDAFYIPGRSSVVITALEDCCFYIAAAIYEGFGEPFFREFNKNGCIGDIHQIHGNGVSQREVFMTLSDKDEASRLICGLTWGGGGAWTSWPPHQHEKDLEEIYCYFDMPLPHFGLHISYLESGRVEDIVSHTVFSGTIVQAPRGYHPTVAAPGSRNSYFWVLGAFSHASRSYDLAVLDPKLKDFNS